MAMCTNMTPLGDLGAYDIKKQIGEGSFGKVYLARHKETQDEVAVKCLSKQSKWGCNGISSKEIENIRHECEIQKNLNHPNILKMIESFELNEMLVIVTEYCPRGDLSKLLLEHRNGITIERMRKVAGHLTSALHYLHSRRIMHRDMKPQNVLISGDGLYKLCDFGFAKAFDLRQYVLLSVKGTPLYMAPEIIEQRPYDHNADLWSMGCILYELVVGAPPFYTTDIVKLVNMIEKSPIIYPAHVTDDSRSFLQGLLSKNPQQRLTWPKLLEHPFVAGVLNSVENSIDRRYALTVPLSRSQEEAKERQRKNLQRQISECQRKLIRTTRKVENLKEAQKQLQNLNSPAANTFSSVPPTKGKASHPVVGVKTGKKTKEDVWTILRNLNLNKVPEDEGSGSSCETLTSSSDGMDSDDDACTVIKSKSPHELESKKSVEKSANSTEPDYPPLWNNEASFGDDKSVNEEEWFEFLASTMREIKEEVAIMKERSWISMIVPLLRNRNASSVLIRGVVVTLTIPFLGHNSNEYEPVLTSYYELKIIPNILFACNTIIIRRKIELKTTNADEIMDNLTEDDKLALVDCCRMVSFLCANNDNHFSQQDFLTHFINSICVLNLIPILRLLVKHESKFMQQNGIARNLLVCLSTLLYFKSDHYDKVMSVLQKDNSDFEFATIWTMLDHEDLRVRNLTFKIISVLTHQSKHFRENFFIKNLSLLKEKARINLNSCDNDLHQASNLLLTVSKWVETEKF